MQSMILGCLLIREEKRDQSVDTVENQMQSVLLSTTTGLLLSINKSIADSSQAAESSDALKREDVVTADSADPPHAGVIQRS